MKKKLADVLNSLEALNKLSKKDGLKFGLNFLVANNCKKIEGIAVSFQSTLDKLRKELGGKLCGNTGTHILDDDESKAKVIKEASKLLEEEIDIEVHDISKSLFEDSDVNADILRPLLWMIKD